MSTIEESFACLRAYCEKEQFKGWDPYDGLNSKLFQRSPLRNWDLARLMLIQACKRSPVNMRPILRVPKGYNAKGVGLLLNGYCNLHRVVAGGERRFGSIDSIEQTIHFLSNLLLSLRSPGYSGSCWGYNFDWQARRLFFFPAGTPTVVATAFCASALFHAYEITGTQEYLDAAISSGNFVLRDLRRTPHHDGFLLSYSPLEGNNTVYNASLLGGKLLSLCYRFTGLSEFQETAREIVSAASSGQREDGAWVYGLLPIQSWIDSFHTGYNLDAIAHYGRLCNDHSFDQTIEKGLNFYLKNFFMADGTPKYYHDRTYPIDIHCPGQLWVTMSATGRYGVNQLMCSRVAAWTITNMQAKSGYFYYQLHRGMSSRIPYMRWSNAFMFNAMSYLLLESRGQ